jgi:malic enzyme
MIQDISTDLRGQALLRSPLLNKGSAFTAEERKRYSLEALLPPAINTQDQQAARIYATLSTIEDPLAKYRELASLQDRNEYLFYRVLMDHLEEFMPVVYTPTVGLATQKFSEVFQRGRGIWINPGHKGRIKEVLKAGAGGRDIRLTVVTDNESILGIGDQGAGGMAISVGKLSLYTAAAGIDPAGTLPVSLDVGTNNQALLDSEMYLGWRAERLEGDEYIDLIDEFVDAFTSLFPQALIQWEDFRKDNALSILDRYKDRVLSFNDDIQGTGAVTLAGILSALRMKDDVLAEQRIVIHGAGAAGLGIARQIKIALEADGVEWDQMHKHIAVLDSRGLLVDDEPLSDDYKAELAWPSEAARTHGLAVGGRDLARVVAAYKPTVLIGSSGQPGAFTESIVKSMYQSCSRPIVMPLSNPTANCEALPVDLIEWTDGHAIVATGSPFPPVSYGGREIRIGQGNNVFIFPALGLGSVIGGANKVTDAMITATARSLADEVTDEELEQGLVYPDVSRLRAITAKVAGDVCRQVVADAVGSAKANTDFDDVAEKAMWWPEYPNLI